MKPVEIDSLEGKSIKGIARIKQKLRQKEIKDSKQYNSLCYDIDEEASNMPLNAKQKGRKSSRKDLKNKPSSPARLVRSKSRHMEKSVNKGHSDIKTKHDIGSLYGELMAVKSEYKKLKGSYEQLAIQKIEMTSRGLNEHNQYQTKIEEMGLELDRYRKNAQTMEQELQRIKKECMRLIETQKFKNKKLEQIIQEKDLMISFLRSELDKYKRANETAWTSTNQSALVFCHNSSQIGYSVNSLNGSNIITDHKRNRQEEDSLCFSRDQSKQMESINSLLTNNQPHFLRKECVVIEPKTITAQISVTQPQECLTFEQRYEDVSQLKQAIKMPPRVIKKQKSKSKTKKHLKRLHIATQGDQNADNNSKIGDTLEYKMLSSYGSSRQRKKISSARKKA